jgi:hypothetical protein
MRSVNRGKEKQSVGGLGTWGSISKSTNITTGSTTTPPLASGPHLLAQLLIQQVIFDVGGEAQPLSAWPDEILA